MGQNDIILNTVDTAGGTSSGGGTALASYAMVQKDTTSSASYKYYGYVNTAGAWVVKRKTLSTMLDEFAVSAGQTPAVSPDTYAQAWTDRATLDYTDYASAF